MRYEDLVAFLQKYSHSGVRVEIREEIFTVFDSSGNFTASGRHGSKSFSTVRDFLHGWLVDGEPLEKICGEVYELSILCPQGT